MPSGDAFCELKALVDEIRDITALPNRNMVPKFRLRMVKEASTTV
jgi:hypothetical protein